MKRLHNIQYPNSSMSSRSTCHHIIVYHCIYMGDLLLMVIYLIIRIGQLLTTIYW